MTETIKLKNPIKVNGRSISELTHDAEQITVELYVEATRRSGNESNVIGSFLWLGMAAVIAVNPEYSWEDMERVVGGDITKLVKIGGSFFKLAEDAPDETSDEQ